MEQKGEKEDKELNATWKEKTLGNWEAATVSGLRKTVFEDFQQFGAAAAMTLTHGNLKWEIRRARFLGYWIATIDFPVALKRERAANVIWGNYSFRMHEALTSLTIEFAGGVLGLFSPGDFFILSPSFNPPGIHLHYWTHTEVCAELERLCKELV